MSCRGGENQVLSRFDYGGSLVDILQQTDDWLRRNRNEVIALHFTRYIPSSNLSVVGPMIASLLEGKWGAGTVNASTELNTFYSSNGNTWPTLETAITDNQRIFVYFDSQISTQTQGPKPWLHGAPFLTENPFDDVNPDSNVECLHLNDLTCSGTPETLIVAAFNFGLCLIDAQVRCNAILSNETASCFEGRMAQNRTVNVILVDFVSVGPVFQVAADINSRNVLAFTGAPLSTTIATTSNTIMEGTTSVVISDPLVATTIISQGTSAASALHAVNHFILLAIILCFCCVPFLM